MAASGGPARAGEGMHAIAYGFLGLCVVVAIGLVFVVQNTMARRNAERRAALEQAQAAASAPSGGPMASTSGGSVDIDAALAAPGIQERLGEGDKVYAFAASPGSDCQKSALDVLREMAEKYPDDMTVAICGMGTDAAQKSVGGTCAGYLVIQNPDGPDNVSSFKSERFEKSPSSGTWRPDDLRDAILNALRASGVTISEEDAEGLEAGGGAETGATESAESQSESAEPTAEQRPATNPA